MLWYIHCCLSPGRTRERIRPPDGEIISSVLHGAGLSFLSERDTGDLMFTGQPGVLYESKESRDEIT
ncbi:MAG: hypothetical protein NTZ37_02110 [Methanoregula sp.]|nr:hypothetical protein [Methanoregula sp.]